MLHKQLVKRKYFLVMMWCHAPEKAEKPPARHRWLFYLLHTLHIDKMATSYKSFGQSKHCVNVDQVKEGEAHYT
ncbi:hypothetical protein AS132_13670 [Photobacterium sanguinicancri]|nr:hypothetical protein AS132_13670 [Photobacterium sanguinicancri]